MSVSISNPRSRPIPEKSLQCFLRFFVTRPDFEVPGPSRDRITARGKWFFVFQSLFQDAHLSFYTAPRAISRKPRLQVRSLLITSCLSSIASDIPRLVLLRCPCPFVIFSYCRSHNGGSKNSMQCAATLGSTVRNEARGLSGHHGTCWELWSWGMRFCVGALFPGPSPPR
jgi:hypothetical protein